MTTNRSYFSFFSTSKSLTGIIYDTLNWAYEHSPVNLASLTGWHHPSISRLAGNPFWGRITYAAQNGGLGLGEEIKNLAEIASKDPRGIAYCSYGHIPVMLVTRPVEIEQIAIHNDLNTNRNEILGPFTYVFGDNNVFGMAIGDEWQGKRLRLKKWIFTKEALDPLTEPMQEIIDEYIDIARKNNEIPSLENFMITLAMDLFSRSILKTNSLINEADTISEAFGTAMNASSNPVNMVLLKLKSIGDYINISTIGNLDKEKIKLKSIIQDNFLNPNETNLRETNNLLQHFFQDHSLNIDEQFSAAYEDAASILLAGHETTSRLLQFTIMLLTKNPEVLQRLRDEIGKNKPENELWTANNLQKMEYLRKILKECLRLYPPVPVIPRAASNAFVIADIPRCKTKSEYQEAMNNRDISKDIVVSQGTIILISPWITQRLALVHSNPNKFEPDRFKSDSISGTSTDLDDYCALFPFGFGRRNCIGRYVAFQEAQLSIIKLVDNFDFKLSHENKEQNEAETLDVFMKGTLKHKGNVHITLEKRNLNNNANLL